MKATRPVRLAALAIFASLAFQGHASAEVFRNGQSFYGEPAKSVAAARVVDASTAKSVRVAFGDTVIFRNAQGKEFAWTFNSLDMRSVDLAKIAPADFKDSKTRIYIGRSPMSNG